ncbi:hypothetical protein AB9K34_00585 [Sedimentitalea sp. XS_ASV28]|uniref:hypothetical protein n=1 Tax=Sedimentitalea sp. XS_ASV28 TaxID=3241296 RepID=UPI00351619CF
MTPQVSERLDVQSVSVNIGPESEPDLALRGESFKRNFQNKIVSGLQSKGSVGDLPVRVVVNVTSLYIKPSKGSSASGTFSVVEAGTGKTISGPNEFSSRTPAPTSTGGGGLLGMALVSAMKGIADTNKTALRVEIEELGGSVSSRIKRMIFG